MMPYMTYDFYVYVLNSVNIQWINDMEKLSIHDLINTKPAASIRLDNMNIRYQVSQYYVSLQDNDAIQVPTT